MYPETIKNQAIKLRTSGLSIKEVSKKLKIGVGTAFSWIGSIKLSEDQEKSLSKRRFSYLLKWRKNNTKLWKKIQSSSAKNKAKRQRDLYISLWKTGNPPRPPTDSYGNISGHIRFYLFDKYDSKCTKCGWCSVNKHTGRIPLHVEHIDGNWKNNEESNLTLLCPNCHSLTSTHGSLNKGRGRPDYYKIKMIREARG